MRKPKRGPFSARHLIDDYFLEEKNPYSKRKPIKTKRLYWAVGIAFGVFVLGVIFLGGQADNKSKGDTAQPGFKTEVGMKVSPTNTGLSVGQSQAAGGSAHSFGSAGFSGISLGSGGVAGARSTQTHSANQVIRRGAGGNDPEAALPMGATIPVRLVNAILSTDSTSPAIAEVTDDVYTHGSLSIPAGARAIGTAQYDESARRIQLRFQTFVYPEGNQHTVSALGMMPDGSAGIAGDYHSGEAKRQVGRFLGYFVSGMADGMMDRKTSGSFGMPYTPGSLKNGVLSGLNLSAQDQAKSYADDMSATHATMSVSSGQPFVLFLEREYVP